MPNADLLTLLISRQRVFELIGQILTNYADGHLDAHSALDEIAMAVSGPLKEGIPL